MTAQDIRRGYLAAMTGALLIVAALLAAPPLLTALGIGVAGALAVWLALREEPANDPPAPAAAETSPHALPEILAAIGDPILLVERQLVIEANDAARALLGDHIVGQDVRLAIRHPAAAEYLSGKLEHHRSAPIALSGLGERERQWELTLRQLPERRLLVRLADRTETYAAERMRVDFVANASHELRTPLATLLGFIETLEDGDAGADPATRARFLKIMFGEARRMQRLVDDLMSLSRIEAERYTMPASTVALEPLVQEVRGALRTGIEADAARIVVDAAPDLPDIPGDRAQLSQLFHNLIGNALKYGRAGTPVKVTLTPDDTMIHVRVADEGEGIPPEHIPRLTERFYRVDPGRSRALGGTGLGLAIVKHIVERHRGRMSIESEPGRGTTVSVALPMARPALSSKSHSSVTQA